MQSLANFGWSKSSTHRMPRLTRRLWSWRDEFGNESHWSRGLGRAVMAAGADALWPTITTW
jgi:acyl-CoA dehydrogenase